MPAWCCQPGSLVTLSGCCKRDWSAGVEHHEPVHSSDDAADTDDAAVAMAALEQEAAQRIRAQARQSETRLATCMLPEYCPGGGPPLLICCYLAL